MMVPIFHGIAWIFVLANGLDLTGLVNSQNVNPCVNNTCVPPSNCSSSNGEALCLCDGVSFGDNCESDLFVSGTVVNRFNAIQGTILSPDFPDASPDRLRFLYYILQVPGTLQFNFTVNFFCTELNKDYLFYGSGNNPTLQAFPAAFDISFLSGCYNGTNNMSTPFPLTLEGDTVWFRYDTDRNIQSQGFNITYTIVGNPPTITCPRPVFVESLENDIGSSASWPDPTCVSVDRPGQSILQTSCTREPGAFFVGLGPNNVTCTCTDNLGVSDSCVFIVTVTAFPVNTPPVVTCPDDVIVASLPGDTGNTASWPLPTCTDVDEPSSALQVSCNPPSGDFFPVGNNQVVCSCGDSRGAVATCRITVTVTRDPGSVCDGNPCFPNECRPTGRITGATYTCHLMLGEECQV